MGSGKLDKRVFKILPGTFCLYYSFPRPPDEWLSPPSPEGRSGQGWVDTGTQGVVGVRREVQEGALAVEGSDSVARTRVAPADRLPRPTTGFVPPCRSPSPVGGRGPGLGGWGSRGLGYHESLLVGEGLHGGPRPEVQRRPGPLVVAARSFAKGDPVPRMGPVRPVSHYTTF